MSLIRDTEVALDGVTLTDSYAGNTSGEIDVSNSRYIKLEIDYAMGAQETENTLNLVVDYANPDNRASDPVSGDWYQQGSTSNSSGTITVNEDHYEVSETDGVVIPIELHCQYIRVKAKETGVDSNYGKATVTVVKVETESIN